MADDHDKEDDDEKPVSGPRAQQDASRSNSGDVVGTSSPVQSYYTNMEKESNDAVRISVRTSSQAENPNSELLEEASHESDVATPRSRMTPAYREMREGMLTNRGSDAGDDNVRLHSISEFFVPGLKYHHRDSVRNIARTSV